MLTTISKSATPFGVLTQCRNFIIQLIPIGWLDSSDHYQIAQWSLFMEQVTNKMLYEMTFHMSSWKSEVE